mgnify:CR=1 FL=1
MSVKEQTREHIRNVGQLINTFITEMLDRVDAHDASKLVEPEAGVFEVMTAKLKGSTYGSPEYAAMLAEMKPALDHHYANNRHHPEFHKDGIKGMSLQDLVEMLMDWKAATLRHADGDILKSIELNQKRFGYSDELKQVFINTINEMGVADRRAI